MKDKEKVKKVHTGNPKVNRMNLRHIRSKIKALLERGDNSIYLKHLILRSCKSDIIKTQTLIRRVYAMYNRIGKQQLDRYLNLSYL